MTKHVVHRIGPGEDFETLAAWAAALPRDLTRVDEVRIAELTAARDDPGGVVVRALCDGERFLEIRTAPGHGFATLTDPLTDPIAPGVGLGAMVHCADGDAIRVEGPGTRLMVRGLHILAEDGAALIDDEAGAIVLVDSCLIEAVSAHPAVTVRGPKAFLRACGIVQRGCGDGIRLADGARAEGVTLLKPERPVADGIGIAATGHSAARVQASAVFGFRQAYGYGLDMGPGLACDQSNLLSGPENFANPAWQSEGATVDPLQTVPGPFAVPLRWLGSGQTAYGRFEHVTPIEVLPAQTVSFSVLTAGATARSSGLVMRSSAGNAALKIYWVDTPPSTALSGQRSGLAAEGGGLMHLDGGCSRLWLTARNMTNATIKVQPLLQVSSGVENFGLNVGFYAGCAMAATGHLGHGFIRGDAVTGVDVPGLDPWDSIRGCSASRIDLRPIEGGPLDCATKRLGADLFGRSRLSPGTVGAISLNPAPRFVSEIVPSARARLKSAQKTHERLCP